MAILWWLLVILYIMFKTQQKLGSTKSHLNSTEITREELSRFITGRSRNTNRNGDKKHKASCHVTINLGSILAFSNVFVWCWSLQPLIPGSLSTFCGMLRKPNYIWWVGKSQSFPKFSKSNKLKNQAPI